MGKSVKFLRMMGATATTEEATKGGAARQQCRHYWIIERPAGPASQGVCKFEGYWQDIGTVESYYQANMGLAVESPPLSLDGDWPIFTKEEASSTSLASNMTRNSLISPGCMVKGRVENSVLSPGVRVESEAVVRDSLVMRNCVIGRHSVVEHCILDEGVTVGEYSYVGFGTRLLPGNREITIVGKRAIIPSHSAIGRNCKIYPGVDHLDFRIPVVPAGTAISQGEVCSHIQNVGANRAAHRQGHGALPRRQADAGEAGCKQTQIPCPEAMIRHK